MEKEKGIVIAFRKNYYQRIINRLLQQTEMIWRSENYFDKLCKEETNTHQFLMCREIITEDNNEIKCTLYGLWL